MVKVYTDGGARGNPGPSAIGVYITNADNKLIIGFGKPTGISTNNVAEYKAVIDALSWLVEHPDVLKDQDSISFFLDSQLICSQVNGLFKVKNSNLAELLFQIRQKEAMLGINIKYSHIPREENKKADKLVNMALDKNSFVSHTASF